MQGVIRTFVGTIALVRNKLEISRAVQNEHASLAFDGIRRYSAFCRTS